MQRRARSNREAADVLAAAPVVAIAILAAVTAITVAVVAVIAVAVAEAAVAGVVGHLEGCFHAHDVLTTSFISTFTQLSTRMLQALEGILL